MTKYQLSLLDFPAPLLHQCPVKKEIVYSSIDSFSSTHIGIYLIRVVYTCTTRVINLKSVLYQILSVRTIFDSPVVKRFSDLDFEDVSLLSLFCLLKKDLKSILSMI